MNDEKLKLTIYLAGYAEEIKYRDFVKEHYGDEFKILDPMTINHLQVIDDVGKNEYDTYIVRRDKKMILSSDILSVYIDEYGGYPMWGTTMEIIFAYEHGIPVYVIDVTPGMKHANNAWVKFHTKKSFDSIVECFDYITSKNFSKKLTPI
jgi:nucleoside 2-deoxyribosyltransferase